MQMKWAIFDQPDGIHIIPCNDDGYLLKPHIVDVFCDCEPTMVICKEFDRLIITHHTEH